MTVIEKESILNSIKQKTLDITNIDDFLGFYQFLQTSIDQQRERIEKQLSYVDLIIVENLYKYYEKLEHHNILLQKEERETFDIFVLGDFEHRNQIVWELSDIFADFFVEYLIMPVFETVTYQQFEQYFPTFNQKFSQGIIIYESKRGISRNRHQVSRKCQTNAK